MLNKTDLNSPRNFYSEGLEVVLEVIIPDAKCKDCGYDRLRPRMRDIGGVKRVKTHFCPKCRLEDIVEWPPKSYTSV